MLRVWRPFGQELAAICAAELRDGRAVKKRLRELHGFPVYLQQLVHEGRILTDDAKLDGDMDLQLVLWTISCLPQHLKAKAARDLVYADHKNHTHTVWMLVLTRNAKTGLT